MKRSASNRSLTRNLWLTVVAAAFVSSSLAAQTITVSPTNDSVVVGNTKQFTATVTGLSSAAVTWSVAGVVGGSSVNGTISATGLYTAPMTPPGQNPVTVTATSTVNGQISGSAYLVILTAGPTISSVSPNPLTPGMVTVTIGGSGFLIGATVMMLSGSGSPVQLSTSSVSSTKITASGYLGSGSSASFAVKNPGSGYSNWYSVPVKSTSSGYSLTVLNGSGSGSYAAGTVVTITANAPQSGQSFQSWTGAAVANPNAPTTTLTMPAAATTVTANFTSGPTYALTVNNGSGSGNYAAGTVVTITANAAPAGQMFSGWTGIGVTVASPASATSTVSMPAAAASVTANYAPLPTPTITQVTPSPIPVGVFSLTITGTNFLANSVASLGGKVLASTYVSPIQLTVSGFNSTSGPSSMVVSNGSVASAQFPVQLGPANALVSVNAARHFLQQAAFGPTSAEAANVQTLGFQGWLNQQFGMPKISNYSGIGSQSSFSPIFLTNAVNNADQLRQRVAFALSEIMVTSIVKNIWTSTTAPFEEMLMTDAFSNFRQILNDVTLAPAMGQFLDMANNAKANAAGTTLPNENYAREVMQLFTIGTAMLNQDGTKQLDALNHPIPTYDQTTVANFAKVFTGWTNAPTTAGGPVVWGAYINPNAQMVPYDPMHDKTPKTLLQYLAPTGVYTTLPAGQNAQTDLTQALDNIFYHPNVPPFIARQLIQHLVKSNPSAAYVKRIADVFANNGSGVRGDMKAVITAILLDPDARQNDVAGMTQVTDGHLQEPLLFMAGFLRALNATVNSQNYYGYDMTNLGQDIYGAPSVFNYFSPGYMVPAFGIGGPEFQIYTPYTAVYRDNLVSNLFSAYNSNINTSGPGTSVDLTPFVNLASNPQTLVDALDLTLTNGLAPAGLKTILLNAIQAEAGGNLRRVQTGLYLMLASSYYNVWN